MDRPILLTGFEPFLDVQHNPTQALVRALDGRRVRGVPIVGLVLPVTYAGGPAGAVAKAREIHARLVLGFGVAQDRDQVCVEQVGRRTGGLHLDNDGCAAPDLGDGPAEVAATLDAHALAADLGGRVSTDAGGYVCNAWAWTVPQILDVPAAFVHVPSTGVDPERVLSALVQWLGRQTSNNA
ncbi:MAG: hypothetical protein AB8H79_23160 [Myxococcota bacterium]